VPRIDDALELGRRAQVAIDHLRDVDHCANGCGDLDCVAEFVTIAYQLLQERSVLERQLVCSKCACPVPPGTGIERNRRLTPMCITCQAQVFGEVTRGNRSNES
jgi:hypothetical protein